MGGLGGEGIFFFYGEVSPDLGVTPMVDSGVPIVYLSTEVSWKNQRRVPYLCN